MNKIVIKEVNFKEHIDDIKKIRTTVFIEEQNVPEELEWDEFDDESIHVLAYYDNNIVGTARLLQDGHIGRMAVLKQHRNRQVGKSLLNYLIDLANKKGYETIELSAQEHAVEFYKKLGFTKVSDVYLDAGIPHYDMKYIK